MEEAQQELTSTMQMRDMLAQMARMQAELDTLKQRTQNLPELQPVSEQKPEVSTTRRKTLKRLGLALLGGTAAATVTGFSVSEAKVSITNTVLGLSNTKAGAVILLPGAPAPTGYVNDSDQNFGLIASGNSTALDLSDLPSSTAGVFGISTDRGVYGTGNIGVTGSGTTVGVQGAGTNQGIFGTGNIGVVGSSANIGVQGSGSNIGVYGTSPNYGVSANGTNTGILANGTNKGVFAGGKAGGVFASSSNVRGELPGSNKVGVIGVAGTDLNLAGFGGGVNYTMGVYGYAPSGEGVTNSYAGYFAGHVWLSGTLSKGAGSFKIDHPLDPANKFLYHSFVESPDMMNIYNGIVTLDAQGKAVVEMPDWFEALNSDFRYQLTAIGVSMPDLFISQELTNRRFKLGGGRAGQRVSWQVTGIRQDAFARAHRIPVEEDKAGESKGTFLHPELFG